MKDWTIRLLLFLAVMAAPVADAQITLESPRFQGVGPTAGSPAGIPVFEDDPNGLSALAYVPGFATMGAGAPDGMTATFPPFYVDTATGSLYWHDGTSWHEGENTVDLDARDVANRNRSNHTGEQAITTVTGLQAILDAIPGDIDQALADYLDEAPDALDALAEVIALLASGETAATLVDAIEQLSIQSDSYIARNDVRFTIGSNQGGSGAPAFSGWGNNMDLPGASWNSVRISNFGRTSAPTDADKWSTIRVYIYDGDLSGITWPGAPVATGEVSVDPNTATYSQLLFELEDGSGDPITLTDADFPSGTIGIAYVAINSSDGMAVSGRATGVSNSILQGSGYAWYITQGATSFLADAGNTKLAISLEYRSDKFLVDPAQQPIAEIDYRVAGTEFAVGQVTDYETAPVHTIGNPGAATSVSSTFAGWGMDMTPPAEEFGRVRLYNLQQAATALTAEKWRTVEFRLYDGSLSGDSVPGDPVAIAIAEVDPAVTLYPSLTFPQFRDPNTNELVTLTAADFPSGTMGAAYVAIAEGGDARHPRTRAKGVGRAGPGTNELFDGDTYYITTAATTWLNDASDISMTFEFSAADLVYSGATDARVLEAEQAIDQITASTTNPVHGIGSPAPATTVTSTFAGWGMDMTPPASAFARVKLYNVQQDATALTAEKWHTIEFRLYDGSLAARAFPGDPVAIASVAVDPDTALYDSLTFPQFQHPLTGSPVTLTAADFPSGTMGAAYVALAEGGAAGTPATRARGIGRAGPGTNELFAGDTYYITTSGASTTWANDSADSSMTFEFAELGLVYTVTGPAVAVVDMPYIYAVEGREANLYLDNIFPRRASDYVWDVSTSILIGRHEEERWTVVPTGGEVASGWTVTVTPRTHDLPNATIDSHVITARGAAITAGSGTTRKLLGIGDSTMANGIMLTELDALFDADVMGLTMVGTKGSGAVKHEGISGKTGEFFATDPTSPFFAGGASLNISDYITTNSLPALAADDWVLINLGINDMFSQTADSGATTKAAEVSAHYTTLINAFESYQPALRYAIALTIPPCAMQSAFGDDYNSGQNALRCKQNIVILNNKIITDFGGREAEGIYLVPIVAGIDTVWGFPHESEAPNSRSTDTITRWTNGVHPSDEGYAQIADQVFAFLKYFQ